VKKTFALFLSSAGVLLALGLLLALSASTRAAPPPIDLELALGGEARYVVAERVLGQLEGAPRSAAAGDLDRDGDVDLVSDGLLAWSNPYTDPFASPWPSTTLAPGVRALDVALGDLDRDGDLDLAAGGDFGLVVWQNPLTQSAAAPLCAWPISHVLTTAQPVAALAIADLDRDGWPDLVSARFDPTPSGGSDLTAWRNPHALTGAWSSLALTHSLGIYTLVAADLDRDGWIDLATGAGGPTGVAPEARAWRNDHTPFTGAWASRQVVDVFMAGGGSNANSVAAADLDADGWPDLAVGYQAATHGAVGVWRNPGAPFSMPWTISATMTGGARVWRVAAGDMDLDGDVDVVSAGSFSSTGNEVTWWWNDGTPFDDPWLPTWAVGPWRSDLLLADLNGDAGLETVVAQQDPNEIVAYIALWERERLPIVHR